MKKNGIKVLVMSMALALAIGSGAVVMNSQSKASKADKKTTVENTGTEDMLSDEEIAMYENNAEDFEEEYNYEEELSDDMSVEEVKEYFLEQGYEEEDLEMAYLFSVIEDIKEECDEEDQVLEQVDKTVEEWMSEVTEDIATCSNPLDGLKASVGEKWYNFKYNEKRAFIMHPAKGLASYILGQHATAYTVQIFGINGLGDPSDAFRHAMWCALMARNIGHKYADLFATAHETGPVRGESDICADGFKLDDHREMDLHNNEVGMSFITEYDTKKTTSDEELAKRVLSKLTGHKETGLIWLHE